MSFAAGIKIADVWLGVLGRETYHDSRRRRKACRGLSPISKAMRSGFDPTEDPYAHTGIHSRWNTASIIRGIVRPNTSERVQIMDEDHGYVRNHSRVLHLGRCQFTTVRID